MFKKIKEKSKGRKFRISLYIISLICILMLIFFAFSMNIRSTQAISHVGTFYMQGMSEQIAMHFQTAISLRLNQVESLVDSVNPDDIKDVDAAYEQLTHIAKANGFKYLALMSETGKIQTLYGKNFEVAAINAFLRSLNNDERKVAIGIDEDGNKIILLGVSAVYPMKGSDKCTALIAALPVDYITEILSLKIDASQTYSFIIRKDGSFVIRTDDRVYENYYDRVADVYGDTDEMTVEQYTQDVKDAIANDEPFSSEMMITGDRRQIYGVKLENSEWYLLTFMPYGEINQTIDNFSKRWMFVASFEIIFIVLALLVVFIFYRKMNIKQMKVLEEARKTAVEAQEKAEKASRAKSEFLSNVSHDIRTPMNAIVGMTSIAITNINDSKKVENCLDKINVSSKHLLGLINNVLDMSKIENGKMTLSSEEVSLRELMENMVNIIKPQVRAKNQKFDVVIRDIVSEEVICDSVRLNQVIINFLSNAVKFTPEEGSIMMTLYQEPSEKGDNFVRVHLNVKDNGIGMSKELQKKVFESFVREDSARVNHTEGTGLGMAITKYIIDAMGGTIDVESELGVGTEFKVTVDLEKVDSKEEEMLLPNWNILVVDDDRDICESAVNDLNSMGTNTDWTLDGETAIKMTKENHEKGKDYHFVLIDWKLPNMDGIETASKIHNILGDEVPILLVSAYDCGEVEEDARKAGITEFMSKPLFKSKLYRDLKKFSNSISTDENEEKFDFSGKKVLLAEDNELNWEIAESLLSEIGLELDWAENGKICVDKFTNAPEGYYEAVFMDIRMPIMNGYEATAAIRAMQRPDAKKIPIIAMTADAFAEDVKKCLDCGMNAHVAKPIDIHEIERLLERFLGDK